MDGIGRLALTERAVQAIERQHWLAPLEERLQRAVSAAFRSGGAVGRRAKDVLHGTWLGHPLHSVLTDIPVGAWTAAAVFDLAEATGHRHAWAPGARRADDAIAVGVVGAVAAALAGMTDWAHASGPPRRTGLVHAWLNSVALGLYGGSLVLRRRGRRPAGRGLALAGFGVMLASAYLGGRLVYHDRIGVDHAERDAGPEDFTRALPVSELVEATPRRVDVAGVRIVLVRQGPRVDALGEACAHLGGPLAEGTVHGNALTCPWHGSTFGLEDGCVRAGPATMPQPRFETRVRGGYIEVRRVPAAALAA
jgi:nitrite reductase/ring-hydroxylating ferredoxin subunit/uncharacterized membrane protein